MSNPIAYPIPNAIGNVTGDSKRQRQSNRQRQRTYSLPATSTYTCTVCGIEKPDDEFSADKRTTRGRTSRCKSCTAEYHREYRRRNRDVLRKKYRDWNLKQSYGLTPAEYDALLRAQDGRCAICRRPPGDRRLSVDHDHESGAIRAALENEG